MILILHPHCNISLSFSSSFLVTPALSFQKEPISYSLLINPSSLFSIDQESGEISLTRSLDYETDQHRYLLLVRASENKESLSSAAEVRLSRTKASMSLNRRTPKKVRLMHYQYLAGQFFLFMVQLNFFFPPIKFNLICHVYEKKDNGTSNKLNK